jgi:hypothetical protein
MQQAALTRNMDPTYRDAAATAALITTEAKAFAEMLKAQD